jgi:hypothetical protein
VATGHTTFVSMNGDFPNIGDAVIRRLAFDLVRDANGSTVYTANAPDEWLRQIGVSEQDVVVRGRENFWAWAGQVIRAPRHAVLLLEPGEVILDRSSLRREAGLLFIGAIVRARGGHIILPPRAAVRPSPATLAVHRALCRLSHTVLWRERGSVDIVGIGDTSPDIAFRAGIRPGRADDERNLLVVSLRGHRPMPDATWIAALKTFASQSGLQIVTLSQVRGDEGRAEELATKLGGTHFAWAEGGDLEHEDRVRDLYDSANVVVSDRLHVLIISSLSGAIPAEIVDNPAPKVRIHFEQVGFAGASMDSRGAGETEIVSYLNQQAARRPELRNCVERADESLKTTAESVDRLLGRRSIGLVPQ